MKTPPSHVIVGRDVTHVQIMRVIEKVHHAPDGT